MLKKDNKRCKIIYSKENKIFTIVRIILKSQRAKTTETFSIKEIPYMKQKEHNQAKTH